MIRCAVQEEFPNSEAGNIADWPFVDTQKGNNNETFFGTELKHRCLHGGGGGVVKVPKKLKYRCLRGSGGCVGGSGGGGVGGGSGVGGGGVEFFFCKTVKVSTGFTLNIFKF